MHHIHTHYDNLQLTQNATDTEIRQAYRRLSKKYHPDLSDDPDAHRIMQIVNRAYEVLSNPHSRAEHDKWIALQYMQQQQVHIRAHSLAYSYEQAPKNHTPTQYQYQQQYPHQQQQNHQHEYEYEYSEPSAHRKVLVGLVLISFVLFGLIVWQGWGWAEKHHLWSFWKNRQPEATPHTVVVYADGGNGQSTAPSSSDGNQADSETSSEEYVRPTAAPNGQPFPSTANYIEGYPIISGMGNGRLVIENVRNSSDVFAQLYEKNSTQAIRTFFVGEREQMTLSQLDAGEYFVRYYQLDSGEYLDSESVTLVRNQAATIYLLRGKAPNSQ